VEETALRCKRVALFGKSFCFLSLGFFLVGFLLEWLLLPGARKLGNIANLGVAMQVGAATVPAVQWAICRGGTRSTRAVDVCDALGTLAILIVYSVMCWLSTPTFEQGFLLALITICLLVTRSWGGSTPASSRPGARPRRAAGGTTPHPACASACGRPPPRARRRPRRPRWPSTTRGGSEVGPEGSSLG